MKPVVYRSKINVFLEAMKFVKINCSNRNYKSADLDEETFKKIDQPEFFYKISTDFAKYTHGVSFKGYEISMKEYVISKAELKNIIYDSFIASILEENSSINFAKIKLTPTLKGEIESIIDSILTVNVDQPILKKLPTSTFINQTNNGLKLQDGINIQ